MLKSNKKVAIYPVDKSNISFAIEYARRSIYDVTLTSFSGSGLLNKNIGFYDNKILEDKDVEGLDESQVIEYDEIILLDSDKKNVIYSILKIAETAINNSIKVKFKFDISNKSEYDEFMLNYLNDYEYYNTKKVMEKVRKDIRNSLYMFSKPIIFIGGIIDYTNQDEICLKIVNEIEKRGFSVSLVSDNATATLLDYHDYSSILNMEFGYGNKIKFLNKFLNYVITEDKCDILVVKILGNAFKYNEILTGDFGVNHYIFSQVAIPNYYIGSFMYGEYNDELIDRLSSECKRKYGFEINALHLSNALIDSQYEPIDSEYKTVRLPFHNNNSSYNNDIIITNLLSTNSECSLVVDRICSLI